ncbi:putative serine/threonine protein kinase [Kitasatospora setae KM-6054]|uniref:Putative serine/threonine protein kinase n=1 Tax=Kitasatospora setae (strain ATCC 33774 / DSM 43861 / JCM 3304 / KCC A-0304 / NBRC 14216 / KM-6054) TaxID=452652 RepID=E4N4Z1_KITSK|nr:putative serine/threonine protein kinase [Kitasatospora setae KM-6054]
MDKVTNDRQPDGGPADRPARDARWELPDYAHGRELGAGASGRVVLARHLATGTPVAVKYLLGDHPDQAAFRGEAELLAALDSPHVTRLYEYVESPHGAAIVMELVEGVSLRDLLRAEGGTGPEAALAVLKGSLLGLAAAHRAGVVHRDYKPGNVLVTADGESKLVDFGIAVRDGAGGTVAGTPAYMAPEQWAGRPASPATDVYAATATFFECLTGAKPYAGTTLMELAVQHTEAEIPDTQAPEALRPLIRAGLAKTPEQRPPGAEALVGELEAAAGAAYGADWEERGRKRLAALVALLPLLLPSALGEGALPGATSYATTVLAAPRPAPRVPYRGRLIATAGAVVLVAGALATVASAGQNAAVADPRPATAPPATTSVRPAAAPTAEAPPSPPPSAPPTDDPGPSTSPDPTPSPSPSLSPSPTAKPSPTPKPSPTQTATPTPSPTPPPTPSTAPPVTVRTGQPTGSLDGYTLTVRVPVSVQPAGSSGVTMTFTWTDIAGAAKSDAPVQVQAGPRGTVTVTQQHTFSCPGRGGFYDVSASVTTTPAAAGGPVTLTKTLMCPVG